ARGPARADGRGHRRGDGGQPLPLRHLPAHPCRHPPRLGAGEAGAGGPQGGHRPGRDEGGTLMTTLSRRALLKAGLAVGGGLLVEVSLPQAQAAAAAPVTFQPNGLLRITSDDIVTFVLFSVEMGQGVSTSNAQLVAEELGIDPAKLVVEFAPADRRYDNPLLGIQATGGSTSTPAGWEPYRVAGAT